MKTIAILGAFVIALTVLLAGCHQGFDYACDGHGGHATGYANGWVKCSDGTTQSAG